VEHLIDSRKNQIHIVQSLADFPPDSFAIQGVFVFSAIPFRLGERRGRPSNYHFTFSNLSFPSFCAMSSPRLTHMLTAGWYIFGNAANLVVVTPSSLTAQ
jgi:hypothetical protein